MQCPLHSVLVCIYIIFKPINPPWEKIECALNNQYCITNLLAYY